MFFGKRTRYFKYSIPDLNISGAIISVKSNECKTIDDLRNRISSNFHISQHQLYFENVPNKKLKNIDDHYNFKLNICSSHPDVDLLLPGGKKIAIQNCYKMKFNEILPILEENGYFYSSKLIKNHLQLFLNNKQISLNGFPFLSSSKNSHFELKFKENPIVLPYGKFLFSVAENENSSEITNLVEKAYRSEYDLNNILILDSYGKMPKKMKSFEKYKIIVEIFVKFTNVNKSTEFQFLDVDLNESVFRVKKSLSKKINRSIENLIIYDSENNKIPDSNKPLSNFQSLNTDFFYRILKKPKISRSLKRKKVSKDESFSSSISISSDKSESDDYYSDYYNYSDDDDDDYDDYKRHNHVKSFFFSIHDLSIKKRKIRVDIDQCKTIYDLKKKISYEINVPNDILHFSNKKLPKYLKKIKSFYSFKFILNTLYPDINIIIPGGKKIKIKDGYKLTFNEIIYYINQEGLYFSDRCFERDIHLFQDNDEIPIKGFPFLSSNKNTIFELKLTGRLVVLKFNGCRFVLQNKESSVEAEILIEIAFPEKKINIVDIYGNNYFHLSPKGKYRIRDEKRVEFTDINSDFEQVSFNIDYYDTCYDITNMLADEFEMDYEDIKPLNFKLYDYKMFKIDDYTKPIGSIQKFGKGFYFKIINKKQFLSQETEPRKRYLNLKKYEREPRERDFDLLRNEKMQRKRNLTPQKREPRNEIYQRKKDRFEMVIGSEEEDEKTHKKEKFNKKDQISFESKFGLADSYRSESDSGHGDYIKKPLKIVPKAKNYTPQLKKNSFFDTKQSDHKNPFLDADESDALNMKKVPQKKRWSSVSRFKPNIEPICDSTQNLSFYKFRFKNFTKRIQIEDNSTLQIQEQNIKKAFDIPKDEQLLFNFVNVDGKSEKIEKIESKNMFLFKNGIIIIEVSLKSKPILILDLDQIKDLKVINKIKNDESGNSFKVQSKSNPEKFYVHKIMKKKDIENFKNFMKDHQILRKLDHPSILKTYGIFINDNEEKEVPPSILLENYSTDLEKFIKNKKKKESNYHF